MQRLLRALAALAIITGLSAPGAAAQIDQIPADSVPADTVDQTARLLEAREQVTVRVPTIPLSDVEGPRAALSRIVFTRDSLEWTGARTVGDLLALVPGTYAWRGGWVGRPEPINYHGRGASSVEYRLDGLPYLPIGPDSTGIDPALVPLALIERIEIERWPGQLRVHLFTSRHDRAAARSRLGVATGDGDLTRYEGLLERRFPSGLGFGVAADYIDAPVLGAVAGDARATSYWLQGSYLPNDRFGLQYQVVRSDIERDAYVGPGGPDPIGAGREGRRTDQQLRLFLRGGGPVAGRRLDLFAGRTGWDDAAEGGDQGVTHLGAALSGRSARWSGSLQGFWRSRWTPIDLQARTGWSLGRGATVDLEGAFQRHDGDRSSRWVAARAGTRIGPFLATGSLRTGYLVAAPAVATSGAQRVTDFGGRLAIDEPWIGLHAGWERTSAFVPATFAPFAEAVRLTPVEATDWLTAGARIQVFNWLGAEGWFSTPAAGDPNGVPPSHFMAVGTIRSNFLRRYRSGIFDLKLQLGVEGWDDGVLGTTPVGVPVVLPGSMHLRALVQLRLGDFNAYFSRTNVTAELTPYVPGFAIPEYGTVFGFRWHFLN